MDKGAVSDSPTLGKTYKKDREGKRDKESWVGECKRERVIRREREKRKKPERKSEERGRTKYKESDNLSSQVLHFLSNQLDFWYVAFFIYLYFSR
jgi:hypothetical protein